MCGVGNFPGFRGTGQFAAPPPQIQIESCKFFCMTTRTQKFQTPMYGGGGIKWCIAPNVSIVNILLSLIAPLEPPPTGALVCDFFLWLLYIVQILMLCFGFISATLLFFPTADTPGKISHLALSICQAIDKSCLQVCREFRFRATIWKFEV